MSLSVYIGHDPRWPKATRVAEYSLRSYATTPVDIYHLDPEHLPASPNHARTEFSFLRFLIPHLRDFEGRALYIDQDVIVLNDVAKLFAEAPGHDDWAIACVQHDYPSRVRRPNWASVMLLNCPRLTQWTLSAYLSKNRDWFQSLDSVPEEMIVPLHPRWNRLDYLHEDTGILHYTSGLPCDPRKKGERPRGDRETALWNEWMRTVNA